TQAAQPQRRRLHEVWAPLDGDAHTSAHTRSRYPSMMASWIARRLDQDRIATSLVLVVVRWSSMRPRPSRGREDVGPTSRSVPAPALPPPTPAVKISTSGPDEDPLIPWKMAAFRRSGRPESKVSAGLFAGVRSASSRVRAGRLRCEVAF